jgi:hypothetical protein
MALEQAIPQGLFPTELTLGVVTTNGGITTDYVSLKNCLMAYIVIHLKQAVGHATAFTPKRATAVAGTGVTTLLTNVPIWYGNVSTTNNVLVRQTDAANFAIPVGDTGGVFIIFQIDPAQFGQISGVDADVLGLLVADSSQATNFCSAVVYCVPRYASPTADMPSYIID